MDVEKMNSEEAEREIQENHITVCYSVCDE